MSQLEKTNGSHSGIRNLFNDFFDADRFFAHGLLDNVTKKFPAVNIKETKKSFEVEMAAPGFDKKDFKINVENGILNVSAENKEEKNEENKNYTRREFNYSSFSRSFMLPETADENATNASYKDGMLTVSISKKEEAVKKSKKDIQVS